MNIPHDFFPVHKQYNKNKSDYFILYLLLMRLRMRIAFGKDKTVLYNSPFQVGLMKSLLKSKLYQGDISSLDYKCKFPLYDAL